MTLCVLYKFMKYLLTGFKHFFEEMDLDPQKRAEKGEGETEADPQSEDYFSALGDEFGIEWKDVSKMISSQPWVSSHFSLGKPNKEILYKLSAWEVVPGTLTPDGADIRLKPQKHDRSYLKGNKLNKGMPDERRYHLSRKDLIQFLTTGWTPAAGAAAGVAGAAPPPM